MDKKKVAAVVIIIILLLIIGWLLFLLFNREYTVTFDSNGGTKVESQVVKKNNVAVEPKDPTREGYKFLGWYEGMDEKDKKFNFKTKINSDITLYARWEDGNKITGLSINAEKNEILVDEELELKYTVKPSDVNLDGKEAKWTSSDETILAVDQNGKVKGIKAGKATITLEIDGVKATFEITVVEPVKEETSTNTTSANSATTKTKKPTPTKSTKPKATATPKPVTYSYRWEATNSSVGQERLYIRSSEGKDVAGTATITTKAGTSKTVSIPASGLVIGKDTVVSITNIKAN